MSTGQHPQAAPEVEPEAAPPEQDIIRIKGVPPYDGDWPCDLSRFTNRELRRIKQVSGIKAAQLRPALLEGDQDALVALTVVMLDRASKFTVVPDLLWDADSEAVEFIAAGDEETEGEEADPNSQTPSEQNAEPPGSSEPNAATTSSGENGEASTETTEAESQRDTGSPPSDLSPSALETSLT